MEGQMRTVTFDGSEGAHLVCPIINVWKDWGDRSQGTVISVQHGAQGKLLERTGDKCKVQTAGGQVGYVTFYFLKEEKADGTEAG